MRRRVIDIVIGVAVVLMAAVAGYGASGKTQAARAAGVKASPDVAKPAVAPAPLFPIGVWYQPASSWAKWRDRGVNTLVGIELEGADRTDAAKGAWVKAAHDFGFRVVGDHVDCDWIVNGPDEPDGQGNTLPAVFREQYLAIKSKAPGKPVWGNFDGEQTRWRPEADYTAGYFLGCDVIAADWYAYNRGMVDDGEGGLDLYAQRVDWTVGRAGGKPVWVAIECGDQDMRGQGYLHDAANQPIGEQRAAAMRGPTPDELEWLVTTAVSRGAGGIFYFSHKVGPPWGGFDTTTDAGAVRMRAINLKLAAAAVVPVPAPLPAAPTLPDVLTINGRTYRGQ